MLLRRCILSAVPFALVMVCSTEATAEEVVVVGAAPLGFKTSSLDFDTLERIGAQAPSEILNRIAGVNVQRNNGLENLPSIRSPVLTGGQSAGSFLVLEDGVPIRAPGFGNVNQLWEASLDFADSLTVVRGPGGAAYGSNAVHGLVDVQTPSFDSLRKPTHWRVEVGGFGRASANVLSAWWNASDIGGGEDQVGGGSLTVASRWLLGAHVETDSGWRSQSGLDRQAVLLRGETQWANAWSATAVLAAQNLNQETASFIEGREAFKSRAQSRVNPTPEAYRDARLMRASIALTRDLDAGWRFTVTPFARAIEADLNLSFFPSRAQEITRQTGVGAQVRLENATWLLGLDTDRSRGSLFEFQSRPTIGTFTQGLHYDFIVDMAASAVFVEASVSIGEDARVVAGLRGERVDYDYDNRAPTNDVGRFRRIADRTDSFSAITPKFGVVWGGERMQTYAQIVRGARPPQITDLYALQTTQAQGGQGVEEIDSFEMGFRGASAALTFDVSAYHMDKRGSSFRNADGFTVSNAATRHQGVDISVRAALSEAVYLEGWASYARHTYRFTNPASRAGESIRRGNDIDTAPRLMGRASVLWSPNSSVMLEASWTHMGAYFTDAGNTARYPGHDVFDLRADWELAEGVRLSANVRNVLDTAYAERADFAFGQDRYFPGEPRNLSLRLSVQN